MIAFVGIRIRARTLTIRRSTTWDREHRRWSTTPPKRARAARSLPLDEETVSQLASLRAAHARDRLLAGAGWHGEEIVADGSTRVALRPDGRIPTDWWLREALHEDADIAGVTRISPYSLRHTSATLAFEAGVDLLLISRRLGHSTIGTTADVYTRVARPAQERATYALLKSVSES